MFGSALDCSDGRSWSKWHFSVTRITVVDFGIGYPVRVLENTY
jgi:hypothetical protein